MLFHSLVPYLPGILGFLVMFSLSQMLLQAITSFRRNVAGILTKTIVVALAGAGLPWSVSAASETVSWQWAIATFAVSCLVGITAGSWMWYRREVS